LLERESKRDGLGGVFACLLASLNKRKESGTEIGNWLEFDFVVPPPHSLVEPTQPLRLLDNPKTIERLGLLSQPLFDDYLECK